MRRFPAAPPLPEPVQPTCRQRWYWYYCGDDSDIQTQQLYMMECCGTWFTEADKGWKGCVWWMCGHKRGFWDGFCHC